MTGDGTTISAWNDSWVEPGKSIREYNLNITPKLSGMTVRDLVATDGDWNWGLMENGMSASLK